MRTGIAALTTSIMLAALLPAAAFAQDPDGPREQGVTVRVFDVGLPLDMICEIVPGYTPNVDVLRETIDLRGSADWGGFGINFVGHVLADLEVETAGEYTFRLSSDDGSRLYLDDEELIDNDGQHAYHPEDGTTTLEAGTYDLRIEYFQAGGAGPDLTLEWQVPGDDTFVVVPNEVLSVEAGGARVTSPGLKPCVGLDISPGDGMQVGGVHPSFELTDLRPEGFEPDVSGFDWFDDGDLAVLTWGADQESFAGELHRVSGVQGASGPEDVETTLLAEGLGEPQGVAIVDDEIYVSTKDAIERLVDADGDGFYEERDTLAELPYSGNFHEFTFGLPYHDGGLWVALSVALVRGGDSIVPQPVEDRGTVVRVDVETGELTFVAGGLRTPNGIGLGPDDQLLITDNQGDWLPSSKLVEVAEGAYFGHPTSHENAESGEIERGRFDDQPVTDPIVWMPQNEIANSPSTPVVMEQGPFAGQLAIGDVTYGGIQRVQYDVVDGVKQGALYRMTQGLEAGVNQLVVGPDGALYIGGIGWDGNWAQPGKLRYGLQKLAANDTSTMDIVETRITEDGFDLTYTQPVSPEVADDLAAHYQVEQWRYQPTSAYGGPKVDEERLFVTDATLSGDGTTVSLEVPGVKPGRVVHIRSPRPFESAGGEELWSTEVWYTANEVPGHEPVTASGWYEAEEAVLGGDAAIDAEHNGYSGGGFVDGFGNVDASVTFEVHADAAGPQPIHLRYANGPHPEPGARSLTLDVDGGQSEVVSLPATDDWQTWDWFTTEVDLVEGDNRITFSVAEEDHGHVNLDLLRVGDDADICAPAAVEDGFTALFDGTLDSFEDWRMAGPGSFGRQHDCTLLTWGGMGLLWHAAEQFESYRLRLDWKLVDDDNSGIFVGFPDPGNDPWVAVNEGYEIQIDESDEPDRTTGAIYTFQGADRDVVDRVLRPWGEWNAYEIRVADGRIQVVLNGELVNDFHTADLDEGDIRDISEGFFGIQNHGSGERVSFRNIRIDTDRAVADTPEVEDLSLTTELDTPVDGELVVTGAEPADVEVAFDTPSDGTVTATGSGVFGFTYAPDAGFVGTDTFEVTVTDDLGRAGTATVTVTVDPAAQEPPPVETVLACPPGTGSGFPDVPAGSIHADAVRCGNDLEVLLGTPAGEFVPGGPLTRGQAASVLDRIATAIGRPVTGPGRAFSDVDDDDTHADAIQRLAGAGVITGYGDGTFRPRSPVSRDELASLVVRFVETTTDRTLALGAPFVDVSPDSAHAEALRKARSVGVVLGDDQGRAHPRSDIRRDQAASVVVRSLRWLPVAD